MESDPLPPELIELESRLRSRMSTEASTELRDRVLLGSAGATPAHQSASLYWSAAAAAILIALNLSMIHSSESAYTLGPPHAQFSPAVEQQIFQQLLAQQNRESK